MEFYQLQRSLAEWSHAHSQLLQGQQQQQLEEEEDEHDGIRSAELAAEEVEAFLEPSTDLLLQLLHFVEGSALDALQAGAGAPLLDVGLPLAVSMWVVPMPGMQHSSEVQVRRGCCRLQI